MKPDKPEQSVFGRNLSKLLNALEMTPSVLYSTEVVVDEQPGKISRNTVRALLNEPATKIRRHTKLVAVAVINMVHPKKLKRPITVEALEQPGFNPDEYVVSRTESARSELDVGWLKAEIERIIATAKNLAELSARIAALQSDKAWNQFWKRLRSQVRELGIDMEKFNQSLRHGGLPPRLPSTTDETTYACAMSIKNDEASLSRDQRLIWRVARAAYPNTDGRDPQLKAAARYLAYYWNYSIMRIHEEWGHKVGIIESLGTRKKSAQLVVYMLSWLELALVLQTGDVCHGKLGLFAFGRYFERQSKAVR